MADLSEKALSKILDSAIDTGIITLDPEGRVVSWNAGAVRVLGWSEAEMRGQPLDRLFKPKGLADGRLAAEIRDAATLGRGGQEGWRIRKDGQHIWVIGVGGVVTRVRLRVERGPYAVPNITILPSGSSTVTVTSSTDTEETPICSSLFRKAA